MEAIVHVDPGCGFGLNNLPWGLFSRKDNGQRRIGIALGDHVVDVQALHKAGLMDGSELARSDCFSKDNLNCFMAMGRPAWQEARSVLQRLLSCKEGALRDNTQLFAAAVIPIDQVDLHMPCSVGDYTDFYASKQHASNVGSMFRPNESALMPNWLHLPVGYHGRSSSIVVSGVDVHRPRGQLMPAGASVPIFAPCAAVDYELEMACLIGPGNKHGEGISIDKALDHIFGLVLMNDWSARDIQKWEGVPLGPFNAKNWATQISPWVVTLDALAPYACAAPTQDPPVLPHLDEEPVLRRTSTYDINLAVDITPEGMSVGGRAATSNLKYMYWSFPQMIAHHTCGGCNLRPGDMLGSGTISGDGSRERGCLLEATWGGKDELVLEAIPGAGQGSAAGHTRKYLLDGDTVTMTGFCPLEGGMGISFGECSGKLLPTPFHPTKAG